MSRYLNIQSEVRPTQTAHLPKPNGTIREMQKFQRKIKFETIKALLARSGNQCAFSNCVHPIFNDNNLFVSQLCHIEAISPEGPRYNPDATAEKVNSYSNLLFLCYRHHKETDDATKRFGASNIGTFACHTFQRDTKASKRANLPRAHH